MMRDDVYGMVSEWTLGCEMSPSSESLGGMALVPMGDPSWSTETGPQWATPANRQIRSCMMIAALVTTASLPERDSSKGAIHALRLCRRPHCYPCHHP